MHTPDLGVLIVLQSKWILHWILELGAYVFIAGNSKVPQGVKQALLDCLMGTTKSEGNDGVNLINRPGMDLKTAERYLKQMEQQGRLQLDAWS